MLLIVRVLVLPRAAGDQGSLGDLQEFSPTVRAFLRVYRLRRVEPVPWAPLRKRLQDCRVALVSSAGFVEPHQAPFDGKVKGGDPSVRQISGAVDVATLIDTHRSDTFDHTGVRRDPNLAFPLDRLRELEASRRIGSVNSRHLSFMGSITAPGRFLRDTVPSAAALFQEDEVDVALLVPV